MNRLFNQSSPRRISAKDLAYFELKQKILEGILAPDEVLVEEELSQELGVSRTPLREALQILVFENLIERQSNGRLKVASMSIKEVEEIFNVRSKLEEIAVEQATENATEDDMNHLTNIVYMIKQTYGDGKIDDLLYYGNKFHNYIYDLSENRTVKNIISQLNDHIYRYKRIIFNEKNCGVMDDSEEHELILERIVQRDKAGAKSAMKKHIQNSLKDAVHAIKKSKYYDENDQVDEVQ
ncbi:hypothetical protein CFK37_09175 [Virgibacillus phasianinus]|uniref:HTH gntR-type domain-containing protein n=1 Tax=Virgibacillus phasianinus TaxID=2017483 RepID=A0A220U317_9BACI|nr:GntR family transcriptional regulator [Virgibacillus phasianinus]ASK62316.1 hypothetical protein CFK37_09175 [Virgibacillus phasianinus]